MTPLVERWLKDLDKDFKAHRAQLLEFNVIAKTPPLGETAFCETLQKLIWRAPNSGFYALYYLWDPARSCLFVDGDMYGGIYKWYDRSFCLASVATTNLDYFVSKCEFSGGLRGERGKAWYQEELLRVCGPNYLDEDSPLLHALYSWFDCAPEDLRGHLEDSDYTTSEEGWARLLDALDTHVEPSDMQLGMHTSSYTVAHWYGLKCAWKQLQG
jgi:hypothetical protein